MMSHAELAEHLRQCADGDLRLEEFEDWFEAASWNVHQQGNQSLIDAVFSVEAAFSEEERGGLDLSGLLNKFRELANAIHPFGLPSKIDVVPVAPPPSSIWMVQAVRSKDVIEFRRDPERVVDRLAPLIEEASADRPNFVELGESRRAAGRAVSPLTLLFPEPVRA